VCKMNGYRKCEKDQEHVGGTKIGIIRGKDTEYFNQPITHLTPNKLIKDVLGRGQNVISVEFEEVYGIGDLLKRQLTMLRLAHNVGIPFEKILPRDRALVLAETAGIPVNEFGKKPLLEEGLLVSAPSALESGLD